MGTQSSSAATCGVQLATLPLSKGPRFGRLASGRAIAAGGSMLHTMVGSPPTVPYPRLRSPRPCGTRPHPRDFESKPLGMDRKGGGSAGHPSEHPIDTPVCSSTHRRCACTAAHDRAGPRDVRPEAFSGHGGEVFTRSPARRLSRPQRCAETGGRTRFADLTNSDEGGSVAAVRSVCCRRVAGWS